jgi:hypothetical protein
MKTVLFTCETSVGTFWIRPEPADRVQLGIDRHKLRTYASAKAAARSVAARTTGYEAWDTAKDTIIPSTLERWKKPSKTSTGGLQKAAKGGVSKHPK